MLAISHFLNGLLMIGVPIILGIFLTHKFRQGWRIWWLGAATFMLSQVGHIPFNWLFSEYFQQSYLLIFPEHLHFIANVLFLGLSAGLWEELTRYLVMRWWAKDVRSWRTAILMGAGHGGIEAILLGTLVVYTYFQMTALLGNDITKLVPQDQLAAVQSYMTAYWVIPWYVPFLGALERVFAITLHISLSVIVWQAITHRRFNYVWLAIGLHALANALALIVLNRWGAYASEASLAIISLVALAIIWSQREPNPLPDEIHNSTQPITISKPPNIPLIEETPENLENSRYI